MGRPIRPKINNPPPNIPSKEEIAQLPRWAQVALAARCARRVQSLFTASWPDASQEHVEAVMRVIELAENAAADPIASDNKEGNVSANFIFRAADEARTVAAFNTRIAAREAGHGAAYAGAHAADAAAIAATRSAEREYSAYEAVRAAANSAARTGSKEIEGQIIEGFFRDFKNLEKSAKENKWDDETAVGPEVFGPMWPEGEPDWEEIAVQVKKTGREKDSKDDVKNEKDIYRGMNYYSHYFDSMGSVPKIVRILQEIVHFKNVNTLDAESLIQAIALHGLIIRAKNTPYFVYKKLKDPKVIETLQQKMKSLTNEQKQQAQQGQLISQDVENILAYAKEIAERTAKDKKISGRHLVGGLLVYSYSEKGGDVLKYIEKICIDSEVLKEEYLTYMKNETEIFSDDPDMSSDSYVAWREILGISETPKPKKPIATIPTMASDKPGVEDLLGRERLARSLAKMFMYTEEIEGLTVALLGDWGEGKSTVMGFVEKALRNEPFEFAKFNAWEYEHTDNIAAGLAQEVVRGLTEDVGFCEKMKLRCQFALREHRAKLIMLGIEIAASLLLFGASMFLFIVWLILKLNIIWPFILLCGGGAVSIPIFGYKDAKRLFEHPLSTELQTYLKLPNYGDHLGLVPVLKRHLKTLCDLRLGKKMKLLVFVDDLDRCQPACISKALDAIRLVMSIPNVIIMIGIDHRIAFKAVEQTYEKLGDDDGRSKVDIARDYLGKIILLPVRLIATGGKELQEYVNKKLYPDAEEVAQGPKLPSAKSAVQQESDVVKDEGSGSPRMEPAVKGSSSRLTSAANVSSDSEPTKKGPEQEIEEAMRETAEERDTFFHLAMDFRFTNPRQLLRLRNCYRLLKALNSQERYPTEALLSMLFWQEFLYGQRHEVRNACMAAIKDKKHIETVINRDAREIVQKVRGEVENLFQLHRDYAQIARFVRCVVLPHSEEGVFDTSEEIDEWISRQDGSLANRKQGSCPLGLKIV